MPVPLIVTIVLLVILLSCVMFFVHQKKQKADEAYYGEQMRRNQERQKQAEEAERQKRMMQRERANKKLISKIKTVGFVLTVFYCFRHTTVTFIVPDEASAKISPFIPFMSRRQIYSPRPLPC